MRVASSRTVATAPVFRSTSCGFSFDELIAGGEESAFEEYGERDSFLGMMFDASQLVQFFGGGWGRRVDSLLCELDVAAFGLDSQPVSPEAFSDCGGGSRPEERVEDKVADSC
jgi:hypothetical protein